MLAAESANGARIHDDHDFFLILPVSSQKWPGTKFCQEPKGKDPDADENSRNVTEGV